MLSISSFKTLISIELRYLSRETVCILKEYYCSAAYKKQIKASSFFTAFRISSLAELSISAFASSFRSPKIAPKGVSYSLIIRIYSESPHLLIAKSIANKRSGILIDLLVFSL
jgi:uncharacterized membrane protein YobD (UPF0266 family)